jgi:hypothetical protein
VQDRQQAHMLQQQQQRQQRQVPMRRSSQHGQMRGDEGGRWETMAGAYPQYEHMGSSFGHGDTPPDSSKGPRYKY